VSRWEELCRTWRKAHLQGKILSMFFFPLHHHHLLFCKKSMMMQEHFFCLFSLLQFNT
jgi:hypothetical protein